MNKNQILSKIKPRELMKFGLNPFHWLTIEENDNNAEIINIDDPELKFRIIFDSIKLKRSISSIELILE